MLRALLIYLSQAGWARGIVTKWSVAWRVASRFVAGETLEDAVRVIKELNERGFYVTLDHLGEYTPREEDARRSTEAIVAALDAIAAEGLKSSVSIKLTQIGMAIDGALAAENLAYILGHAKEYDIFVRIDMEDSTYVDATLELYRFLRDEFDCKIGVVIQSYLFRSMEDMRTLMREGTPVRLVKGAYKEPNEVAFAKKADVDENFDRLTDFLIGGALDHGAALASNDGRVPPVTAIASHDEIRVSHAKAAAGKVGLPKQALEFQMLHGIRRELQDVLLAEGYPVRIYVPYGKEWYPYFMRRLAERPANLWFFISNLLRK